MKRGVCFLMAVLLTAALMGCGNSGGLPCAVLSGVFSYNIEGEMSGVTICGRVFADAPRECDGNQLRRVGIVYSAPEALRGITAACDSFNPNTHETGGVTLTLDGMTVNNAALDGLITPALLLAALRYFSIVNSLGLPSVLQSQPSIGCNTTRFSISFFAI
jgi:hypothetical protein